MVSDKTVTAIFSKSPALEWSKTYGGIGNDVGRFTQQTTDGGYIIGGHMSSLGAGASDFWLVKTDASGNEVWNKTFGGTGDDLAFSGQQTSDGGYILTGYKTSSNGHTDVWLVNTNSVGDLLWDKTFGGPLVGNDYGYSVRQTSDGGYIIAAYTSSFGSGQGQYWWIKTDSTGNIRWDIKPGDMSFDYTYSVQQTSDGGYIFAGNSNSHSGGLEDFWLVKTDSLGHKLWERTFGGRNEDIAKFVQQTSDGGYILVGTTASFGAGNYDFWLVKTDSSGNKLWDVTFGGTEADRPFSVQQTSDGGYIVAGSTNSFTAFGTGYSDLPVVKTDSIGNIEWWKTFGSSGGEVGNYVQQTTDGGYIIVGNTDPYGAGNGDVWLLKLDGATLNMTVNGSGEVAQSGATHGYIIGTSVKITATPADGWRFTGWTGDTATIADTLSANTTILMNDDYEITANFSQTSLTIEVSGSGKVTPSVGSHTYPVGASVNLMATPADGWRFTGWTGDTAAIADNTSANTTILMDDDYSITANFNQTILTISTSGSGNTTPSVGRHTYPVGTSVNITAKPAFGRRFYNWTGDVNTIASVTNSSTNITMNGDYNVTANFSGLIWTEPLFLWLIITNIIGFALVVILTLLLIRRKAKNK